MGRVTEEKDIADSQARGHDSFHLPAANHVDLWMKVRNYEDTMHVFYDKGIVEGS